MRPHHRLEVWKKAVAFSLDIYKVTERFPRDERFGLTSQLRRAAVSIPSNIAEGAGRRTAKDFANFLSIAQGSASEVETQLLIASKLGYFSEADLEVLVGKLDEIGRMVTGLRNHIGSDPKT